MSVAERRILRWMNVVKREYRIRNEYVSGNIRVVSILDKMKQNRFKWFSYIKRREISEAVNTVIELSVEGKRRNEDQRNSGWTWLSMI